MLITQEIEEKLRQIEEESVDYCYDNYEYNIVNTEIEELESVFRQRQNFA
jgi:hypothetical protein